MTMNPINGDINNTTKSVTNNTDKVKGTAENADRNIKSNAQQQTGDNKPVASDQVSLTPSVQKLQEIEKSLAQHPEIDSEKVSKIKELISNNEFKINPERIANKLMELEKLLK